MSAVSKTSEEELLAIFRQLSSVDQAAVASFAQFLSSRSFVDVESIPVSSVPVVAVAEAKEIPEPEFIERPDDEKVVAAIKRLSKTYSMLNKKDMLGATSDLVTQHILHRRDASEVIDELEAIFSDQYRQLLESNDPRDPRDPSKSPDE